MKNLSLIIVCVALLFTACEDKKAVKMLQDENAALKLEVAKDSTEMEELLSLLNEIDDNFQKIKAAENYLTVQSSKGGDLTPSTKERINSDMKLLAETLTKNKEQIAKLQSQLKKSNINSSEFQKLIDKQIAELEEKTLMITELQQQLAQKNMRIVELDEVVAALSVRSTVQDAVILEQDASLNTAYYCFGTSKELKDEKILTGGGFNVQKVLQSGFNKNYFTTIDIREVTQIPLRAKKAEVKSSHPAGTYEFVKDPETKELTFKILDVKEFWSIGRYLVIEVSL